LALVVAFAFLSVIPLRESASAFALVVVVAAATAVAPEIGPGFSPDIKANHLIGL
jgi:hypothetical protein